uniref:Myc-associated zinc finger protein n=1 Tax=Sinocyclocheilus grahami TaxID=75366 RepID=A0A672P9T8_SINGR
MSKSFKEMFNMLRSLLFLSQQANEALHHQHQNSLLPLLNSEPQDQKPVLPILLDQKPPVSVADLLKDNMGSGGGGGGGGGGQVVIKKEPKSKTPFICGYCNKAFRDSYHLRRHESCHTGIKMVSRPKKTTTAPTMVPLISTVPRDNNGNPSYVSTVAGILTTATTSASTAAGVMSVLPQQQPAVPKKPPKPVKKNHGCEMCGKAFRDVYHLNRHKLSHSDEKPFECPICHQRFKRKDRMTYHVRSHDGGVHKPYICSVCGKGFSRPDHLSCHVKHVHSTERPFKCQVTACTSAFATKDRLRSHMIRHEGKVTCNICGKMLSAAYITSHLKTHGQAGFTSPCNKEVEVEVDYFDRELEFEECDRKHYKTTTKKQTKGVLIVLVILNVCPFTMASLPCLNCMSETATVKHISLLFDKTSSAQRWKPSGRPTAV